MKEITTQGTTWMNLKDVMLCENQSQKGKYCVIALYEVCRIVKYRGTESRMVFAKGWGERMVNSCLMSMDFSAL